VAAKRLVLRIAYMDGRNVEYRVTPVLQMGFERNYKIGIDKLSDGNEGAINTYKLAWFVQAQHKNDMPEGFMPTLEDWAELVDGVEAAAEDITPFVPAASANGSRHSASPRESLQATS
jgi:hypothetical protein